MGGTNTTPIVEGLAKAWVNFDGTGAVAVRDSLNLSSLTDNGTRDYTVNFTNAFGAADYCVTGSMKELDSTSATSVFFIVGPNQTLANTYSTTSIRVAGHAGTNKFDCVAVNVAIHGDLA